MTLESRLCATNDLLENGGFESSSEGILHEVYFGEDENNAPVGWLRTTGRVEIRDMENGLKFKTVGGSCLSAGLFHNGVAEVTVKTSSCENQQALWVACDDRAET